MSHSKEELTICPNCGYQAIYNYCAQCGQATHLHNETFGGLILHFVEHYFHYDSKFWKTMKTLWLNPGALSLAYWEKQRQRYISPVSLYIFISAVFFLCFFSFQNDETQIRKEIKQKIEHPLVPIRPMSTHEDSVKYARSKIAGMSLDQQAEYGTEVVMKVMHNMPKFFFCMLPFMAVTLLLVFSNRRDLSFVDHAVFALHVHSVIFSVLLIPIFIPRGDFHDYVNGLYIS